jgi:hypothetical protein
VISTGLNIPYSARNWWLTPVILATQEAEISRIAVRGQPRANSSQDPTWKKPITKIRLVEWLKVKVLSSNLSTTKKNSTFILL